jgi:hypothetical protein
MSLDGVPEVTGDAVPAWLPDAALAAFAVPYRVRQPISLARPLMSARELVTRWPNPIEASVDVGAAFDDAPRLPIQLAECKQRIEAFVRRSLQERLRRV